jgi:acetylornithine deacetylase/succinyl-diaminopimelate desuccinylase-like protein
MVFNLRTVTDKKVYEKLFKKIVMPKIPKSYKYKTYALDSFDSSITKETKEKLKNAFKASKAKYQESIMNAMTELFMFENAKIPGFIFGPGDMNLAHVRPSDERIKVKDILKFSEVLTNFLKN